MNKDLHKNELKYLSNQKEIHPNVKYMLAFLLSAFILLLVILIIGLQTRNPSWIFVIGLIMEMILAIIIFLVIMEFVLEKEIRIYDRIEKIHSDLVKMLSKDD